MVDCSPTPALFGPSISLFKLQEEHSGYNFSINGAIESHHDIARLLWQFGPENNPAAITGQDIFIIRNGKIKKVMVFIDSLA